MGRRKNRNKNKVPPHQLDQTYRMLDLIGPPLDDLDHHVLMDGRGVKLVEVGDLSFSQFVDMMDQQEARA